MTFSLFCFYMLFYASHIQDYYVVQDSILWQGDWGVCSPYNDIFSLSVVDRPAVRPRKSFAARKYFKFYICFRKYSFVFATLVRIVWCILSNEPPDCQQNPISAQQRADKNRIDEITTIASSIHISILKE